MPLPEYTGQAVPQNLRPAPMGFGEKMGSMGNTLQNMNPFQMQLISQLLNHPQWMQYLQAMQRPGIQGVNGQMPVRPAMSPTPMPSPMVGVRG